MRETEEWKDTGKIMKEDQGEERWIGAGRRGKTEKLWRVRRRKGKLVR